MALPARQMAGCPPGSADGAQAAASPSGARARHPRPLGRVERAVLAAIDGAGGILLRQQLVPCVFPAVTLTQPAHRRGVPVYRQRAAAESAVSHALASLERKGLVTRERSPIGGRRSVRRAGLQTLPTWEDVARAEEDVAADCCRRADAWTALARRSQRRADSLRSRRTVDETQAERLTDLALMDRLAAGGP